MGLYRLRVSGRDRLWHNAGFYDIAKSAAAVGNFSAPLPLHPHCMWHVARCMRSDTYLPLQQLLPITVSAFWPHSVSSWPVPLRPIVGFSALCFIVWLATLVWFLLIATSFNYFSKSD